MVDEFCSTPDNPVMTAMVRLIISMLSEQPGGYYFLMLEV